MKIAFVTRSLGGGGAERVVSVLANELSYNNDVAVISIIEDYVTYEIAPRVCYFANSKRIKGKIGRVVERLRYLKSVLKEYDPDIVISFCTQINIYSIFAVKNIRAKLIVSERNDPNRDPIQWYVRFFRDIIYHMADGYVFQTEDAANYFSDKIAKPYRIISNPLKSGLPEPYLGERDKKIVCVARLSKEKNIELLINSFSNFVTKDTNYILELYGQGPEEAKIKKLVKKLGLSEKIHFCGFREDVHECIKKATCFVLPSNYEGISNAMIEALAMGIPTICTDSPIGGARMLINNMQNGILVPVNDVDKLTEALFTVCESEEIQKRFSEQSIKIRNMLSIDNIANQWRKFIDLIINTI